MALTLKVHSRIAEVGREAWDLVAGPTGDPFLSFDFLDACETAGCAVEAQGWGPRHLTLHGEDDRLLAAMPLYLKGHSQGEYVFDHSWADAYERAGGRYYPKLLSAVPFTPVTGPRLLGPAEHRETLLHGAATLMGRSEASSLHVTFPTEDEWRAMGDAGLLLRQDMQFVWRNDGYGAFNDFLGALSSGRRKTIRRERREAQAGLDIRVLTGGEISEAHWDAFFDCYMDTGSRKWGRPYLNRSFFSLIGERMAARIALVMAFRDGAPIAGALNFIGAEALYGRQWGTLEDVPFLHFELCYYRAIEFAIERGLSRVEAGAQGEHKIARGYLPSPVYSAHLIADPGLSGAVEQYLARERPAVEHEIGAMTEAMSPYRRP